MATTNNIDIDFDNPLEPGFDDISLDAFDLQDSKSAIMLKNESMDVFTRRNVFKGVVEYSGLVISERKELVNNPGFLDSIAQTVGGDEKRVAFKIHIPALHAMLGNPCDVAGLEKFGATTTDQKEILIKKIVQQHPWFITKGKDGWFSSNLPKAGDWIRVKFAKGPAGGRAIEGEIVKILGDKIDLASVCPEDIVSIFSKIGNAKTIGSSGASSPSGGDAARRTAADQLIGSLPTTNEDEYITGDERTSVTSIIQQEINAWSKIAAPSSGGKDSTSEAKPYLEKYWKAVDPKTASYNATNNTAWCAAFASWVVKSTDSSTKFSSAGADGLLRAATNDYRAFQFTGTAKVKAQIGDLLINGGARHVDIVYSFVDINSSSLKSSKDCSVGLADAGAVKVALLGGGNLSDLVAGGPGGSCQRKIGVDKDGFYILSTNTQYVSIIKKNGRIEKLST